MFQYTPRCINLTHLFIHLYKTHLGVFENMHTPRLHTFLYTSLTSGNICSNWVNEMPKECSIIDRANSIVFTSRTLHVDQKLELILADVSRVTNSLLFAIQCMLHALTVAW